MFVACIQIKTEVHKQTCGVTKICVFFFWCNFSCKVVSKTQLRITGWN